MTRKKPTIDDVASLSGVGRTTVSRVINGSPNVRDEVRQRVVRAVEMLDYKVNFQARALAGGGSRNLILVHASDLDSEPNSYYHSAIELGALRACLDNGFHLMVRSINQTLPTYRRQVIELVECGQYEAIVLTPPFCDDGALVRDIQAAKFPLVCISSGASMRGKVATIGIDDEVAGFELTQYLLGLGHRHFGYIAGPDAHESAAERYAGFLRALEAGGVPANGTLMTRGNFTFRSGIELSHQILQAEKRPTAIICANDDMAAGALLTAHKLGLEIPADVTIVGFDDTPVSEIVWPPLTTIHQPIKVLGQRAVELAIQGINQGAGVPPPVHETVPFRIVVRESSAQSRAIR